MEESTKNTVSHLLNHSFNQLSVSFSNQMVHYTRACILKLKASMPQKKKNILREKSRTSFKK